MASSLAPPARTRASRAGWVLAAFVGAVAVLAVSQTSMTSSAQAAEAERDSADRLIFWVGCKRDVVEMTDAQLDEWKSRGVDGFVCMVNHLRGMGGSQDFTGDPAASLSDANYDLQRALRDSDIVERAAAREMKMYLGAYLVNYSNTATPLREWFDDAGWSDLALPKLEDLAGAAKQLGFAGIAFDQELYPQAENVSTATWEWDYPGNTHSEAEVRAKAKQRGQEVMEAILSGFPGTELIAYDVQFPESWYEFVLEEVNGHPDAFAARLDIDFWDGLSSVEGYGAIRLIDATFYKTPHRGSWDAALQYHYNRLASLLSRRFSNWDYASSRLFVSPFSWIDEGPSATSTFDDARPPAYVEEQLLAFRKWGMGGELANYAHRKLDGGFDYLPYLSAMQNASSPAAVDPEAPTLTVTTAPGSSVIEGKAHDNLAIRVIRWRDDRGGSGIAELNWKIKSGDYRTGYVWEMEWSIPTGDLAPGATRLTITAEDIKGKATSVDLAPVADTAPPQTKIRKRPRKRSHDQIPRFSFKADEPARSFACSIDRKRWKACNRAKAAYRLGSGRHIFQVRATDRAGNDDPTPARYRFTIKPR